MLENRTLADAMSLAETLRIQIERFDFNEVEHVTCSFGVVQHIHEETQFSLLKRLDKQLYKAKENGRNCVFTDKTL